MSKLVRLYPHNPARGWLVQTYMHHEFGKFVGKRGWYEVRDEVAKELAKVRQKDGKRRSGPAFMIADDKDHARELELELLVDPMKEEETVGTADAPVKARRPGKVKKQKKPKTRTRRTRAAEDDDE